MEARIVSLIPFSVKFLPVMAESPVDNWEDIYNKYKGKVWTVAGAIKDKYGLRYIVIRKGEISRLVWAEWLEVVETTNCDIGDKK